MTPAEAALKILAVLRELDDQQAAQVLESLLNEQTDRIVAEVKHQLAVLAVHGRLTQAVS